MRKELTVEEYENTLPVHVAMTSRLSRLHGIRVSLKERAASAAAQDDALMTFPITVRLPDGQTVEEHVNPTERVVFLKLRLYETPPEA